MKNAENLCIAVIVLSMMIVSGCIGSEMVEELNYKYYPVMGLSGALELNYTDVLNINLSVAETNIRTLNYSGWSVWNRSEGSKAVYNREIGLSQNTTDFKHGGRLDIYIYVSKQHFYSICLSWGVQL